MLSRRTFFGRLAAAAAAAVAATDTDMLDPERLLWTPGKKTIFLPTKTIYKAEDVAVEEIRREFDTPRLFEPGTRILRPDDILATTPGRPMDYRGGRYTLTVPDGRGGLLQQSYDSDWRKTGGVQYKGRSFEPTRPADKDETAAFNGQAHGDWRALDAETQNNRLSRAEAWRQKQAWVGGSPGGGKTAAMRAAEFDEREFMTRFKEKG